MLRILIAYTGWFMKDIEWSNLEFGNDGIETQDICMIKHT